MTILTRRQSLKTAGAAGLVLAAPRIARAADAGKVVYWHHFTSQEEFNGLKRVMEMFKQRYPGIDLQQENIPNPDYMAKFTAAVVANSRPEVSMVASERFADMMGMNGLIDLTDRINAWPNKRNYTPDTWIGISDKGKIYGLPAFTFIDWVYYRKDWFAQAGIAGPPTTLDEFVTAAKKLTDASKNRYGFGMRGGPGGQGYIIDLIEAFGSKFVVDGKNAMDKGKTLAAIKWYSELATVHKVVPPSVTNDGFRQIMEGYKTGQTAMTWHHTGSLIEMMRALKPTELGTAEKPAGPAAHVARVAYQFNGIMKKDNLDASFDWIAFWGENDPSIAFLEETGYFPSSTVVAQDKRITGNPLYLPAMKTQTFGTLPPSFVGSPGWAQNVVLPEFQKILIGQSTPEKATDAILKGLDAAIQ